METSNNPSKTQLELIFDKLFSSLPQYEEFDVDLIQSLKIIANENNFKSALEIAKAINAYMDQNHENIRA
jgi:cystathionine beta-lyase family protein involved in aluminum resistance